MHNERIHWIENKADHARTLAMAALASVALGACGNDSSGEQMSVTQATVATVPLRPPAPVEQPASPGVDTSTTSADTSTAKDCSLRYVEPGENFSNKKRDDIEEDLGLLSKLQKKGEKIRLGDILAAGRIIEKSYDDPLYSQAIVTASDTISAGQTVTVDEFLQTPVKQPAKCDTHHITKDDSKTQLHQTVSIVQTLTHKLGQRIGERSSANAKSMFEKFEGQFNDLKTRLDEESKQP